MDGLMLSDGLALSEGVVLTDGTVVTVGLVGTSDGKQVGDRAQRPAGKLSSGLLNVFPSMQVTTSECLDILLPLSPAKFPSNSESVI